MNKLTRTRLLIGTGLALLADLLQVVLFPLGEGFLSPLNDVLDFVMVVVLTWLLGWHWVFLPTLVAEAVPGLDLAPTWAAAVALVALQKPKTPAPAVGGPVPPKKP